MENLETPRMLYAVGTQCELESGTYDLLVVKDQAELEQALITGWHLDQYAAKAAALPKEPEQQAEQPDDDAPPTRAELEQQATTLGLKFDKRTGDKKLAAMIAGAQ